MKTIKDIPEWKIKAAYSRWNFRILDKAAPIGIYTPLITSEETYYRGSIKNCPNFSWHHFHRAVNDRWQGIGHFYPQVWNDKNKEWVTLTRIDFDILKEMEN